ncbi:MAG: ABC transporter permease subunit [Synergistaceae bacterium]|nr:ABC transporter permease subunit [Synergistaceae bacterium]
MFSSSSSPPWLRTVSLGVGAILASVFAFILFSALAALLRGVEWEFFGAVWSPREEKFGLLPMICGSLILSFSALALGWVLSLGCCCTLRGLGPRWLAKILLTSLRFMTAIPTVVYGFAAVFLLVPVIRSAFGGSGFSWLAAAVMLALQGVPAMTLTMGGALQSIEEQTSLTAAALGLTPLQHLTWVVLPASKKWILSSALLGYGRALGDTLLPIMLAGNAPQFAASPLESLRTLTAHIGLTLSTGAGGGERSSLLLAGGLLLVNSMIVSLTARALAGREPAA